MDPKVNGETETHLLKALIILLILILKEVFLDRIKGSKVKTKDRIKDSKVKTKVRIKDRIKDSKVKTKVRIKDRIKDSKDIIRVSKDRTRDHQTITKAVSILQISKLKETIIQITKTAGKDRAHLKHLQEVGNKADRANTD